MWQIEALSAYGPRKKYYTYVVKDNKASEVTEGYIFLSYLMHILRLRVITCDYSKSKLKKNYAV